MESRFIGVEVICGEKINTTFGYYTDNLMSGGGNLMIEVMRQATHDLKKLCTKVGYEMPRTLHIQYDNCGENKVIKCK